MTAVTDATDTPDSIETTAPRRWLNPLLLGALALAVAAALVAVWFGVAWIKADGNSSLQRATARDEVDRVARSAIVTFNSLDYRKVDEGLANWEAASAGPLHDEVVGRKDSSKQAIVAAKSVTSARVLSLAVTDLNEFDGTATVIAAVEATVTIEGQQPTTKYLRIQGSLQHSGDGWKLSGIGQVDFAHN
jgi:Mce-associated membrane protein